MENKHTKSTKPKFGSSKKINKIEFSQNHRGKERILKLLESEMKVGTLLPTSQK